MKNSLWSNVRLQVAVMSLAALALSTVMISGWLMPSRAIENTPAKKAPPSHEVSWRDATILIPSSWTISSTEGAYRTWADPRQQMTVTITTTEASTKPLLAIVTAAARDSARQFGVKQDAVEVRDISSHGSAAVELAMQLPSSHGPPLHVRQTWVRNREGTHDAIATWTNATGKWTLPRSSLVPTFGLR